MPAFLTHCFFAEDVLKKIKNTNLKQKISKRKALYFLGSQGPDIFFYYRAKPWTKDDGLSKLGLTMHDSKVQDFFIESLKYIKTNEGCQELFDDLSVYVAGYICHYRLDKTAHPLIHYLAGIYKNTAETKKYHTYHRKLESIIDLLMLKNKNYKSPYKFRGYKLIEKYAKYTSSLLDYYKFILNKVYKTQIKEPQLLTAISDMHDILKLLKDPYGLKWLIYKIIEILLGKNGQITSSMLPRSFNKKADYLNLKNNKWNHPCIKDKIFHSSFIELYKMGAKEAAISVELMQSFLEKNKGLLEVKSHFKDESYSTGIKCGSKELKYFNCIFEK